MITPGPWRVGIGKSCVVTDTVPLDSFELDPLSQRYYGGRYLICEAIDPDNAILIAAAPDLLAKCQTALELFEAMYGEMCQPDSIIHELRAVIAQATGT